MSLDFGRGAQLELALGLELLFALMNTARSSGPTHKRTEGHAQVQCFEFTTKAAALYGGVSPEELVPNSCVVISGRWGRSERRVQCSYGVCTGKCSERTVILGHWVGLGEQPSSLARARGGRTRLVKQSETGRRRAR
jgi:hypothetical protein